MAEPNDSWWKNVKPEAKSILLYGDDDITVSTTGLAIDVDGDVILCDFSEAGAHVASGYIANGVSCETVKLVDVLAENPFAAVKALGCDRMRKLVVAEAKAKTAIELFVYLTSR